MLSKENMKVCACKFYAWMSFFEHIFFRHDELLNNFIKQRSDVQFDLKYFSSLRAKR